MKNILVVDDNSSVQRVLSYTLTRGGYQVTVMGDGAQALDLLQESPYDLAIIDLAMPGMDGLTLLRQLRGNPKFKTMPIVMLTASGMDQDRITARTEGANAFLTKPTSSRELLDTVSGLLP